MTPRIRLDHAGIRQILQSTLVFQALHVHAEEIASSVRSQPTVLRHGIQDRVVVEAYTTDRAAFSVGILHAAGKGMEAKHGALTKAAGSSGLQVVSKS